MSRWHRVGRQWSLQTRLVIGVVCLLAVGLFLANMAAVTLIRVYQQQRIDQQLDGLPQQIATVESMNVDELCQLMRTQGETQQLPSSYMIAVTDHSGRMMCQLPASPTVLGQPDLAAVAAEFPAAAQTEQSITVSSSRHEAPWRLRVMPIADGYAVVGISLVDSLDTLHRLKLVTLLVSLAILLLGGLGSWFMVRFALRPLTSIEQTARAIADGNLSQRIEEPSTTTEVGRLTGSLNTMLTTIEQSFDAKVASEERLRRFIADASHELRTPVASIRGHAEMYRQGVAASPTDVAVVMQRIESESIRMGDLVNDLLLLARLDSTPLLDRQPVDLLTVAADTITDARARDPRRPVTLTQIEGSGWVDAPPVVVGDEDRIRQVFGNVVANVLRHTPPGTPYEIGVGVRADSVHAHVIDHGPGLPPAAAQKVFDRFYRNDFGRARSTGGSGLGLSIAAGLMAAHHGTITHTDTPGGGSTFTLTFPLAPAEDRSEASPADT